MNSADKRIEELLNRAGQTISDLPQSFAGGPEAYGEEARKNALCAAWSWYLPAVISAGDAVDFMQNRRNETVMAQYILHLTDIIDRMGWALENQVTLHENLMHVISNADIPEGVNYDQFCLVVDSIYKAIQTAQEGWETYEEGVPKDGSVDDE